MHARKMGASEPGQWEHRCAQGAGAAPADPASSEAGRSQGAEILSRGSNKATPEATTISVWEGQPGGPSDWS